eukprot:scaffold806_cov142-Amphora_coffeaeformis.AAC.1
MGKHHSEKDDDDAMSSRDSSSEEDGDDEEEEPPQPVSSDDEEDFTPSAPSQIQALPSCTGHSRFFAPYRTLGILSNGSGFHLVPHDHSGNAMLCCPTGDRFQLLQTDRLQPVLVSQRVPGRGTQEILATVTDASLSITAAVHQVARRRKGPCSLTLFHRTRPLQRVALGAAKDWQLAKLLHLGRIKVAMKGEKLGKMENAVVLVAVLRKITPDPKVSADEEGVPVVGDDEDDSDSSEDESEEESIEQEGDSMNDEDALGQVVVFVATRTTVNVQRRMALASICPYTAVHPSTYVNKIVIGGTTNDKEERAAMILLNIRSKKVVHSFRCLPKNTPTGRVATLTQSPAVDTIAVGTEYGAVHLVNLRMDRLLFTVQQKSSVRSVSFRTDSSALQYQIAPMAVGTEDGTITVWDLSPAEEEGEEDGLAPRTILCEMKHVHIGGVAQLEYLPQEPLLVSTGLVSNSVKMHIFDNPDHSGRVLRQRAGHAGGPPKVLRYMHPATGGIIANAADGTDAATSCQLLSAGSVDRTVRLFSTARSALDKELGQGLGLEKRAKNLGLSSKQELLLPPVLDMALAQARTRDWGDLVTIHHQHSLAYVWSTKRGAQSGPVLRQPKWNISARKPPPPASTHATSVTLSACGNFCMVGTASGKIYKYNVQSGQPRGSYPRQTENQTSSGKNVPGDISKTIRELEKDGQVSNRKANLNKKEFDAAHHAKLDKIRRAKLRESTHSAAVTGLAVDAMNKTLISVGSDAKLILWNFSTHGPHRKSPHILPSPASKMVYVRDSDMAAIALEDYAIFLFDCTALNVVRRLGVKGARARHTGPIVDMEFSPDGRSLYTASVDSTIRMWDIPTSACVDWMSFDSPPTSLTVSPTGEFLATTHAKSLGICLWSDRSFYQTIHTDGKYIDRPYAMDDPVPLADSWETESKPVSSSEAPPSKGEVANEDEPTGPASAKEPGLITLSGLPAAHWKNLFHLELVKERNKPKEPPKKPPSAPFFLQWRRGEEIAGAEQEKKSADIEQGEKSAGDDQWASAWSDDNEGDAFGKEEISNASKRDLESAEPDLERKKRPKVTRYRSELATILDKAIDQFGDTSSKYQAATDYVAKLGPSAIDVELSSLCAGMHDLEDGLPLLGKACDWLLECCQRRERFEAVNAYLHRFLHLHASVIAGIKDDSFRAELSGADEESDESVKSSRAKLLERIALLRKAQHDADEILRDKMQHSLCLLRHLTRMV